jgi:hypothetical protein
MIEARFELISEAAILFRREYVMVGAPIWKLCCES